MAEERTLPRGYGYRWIVWSIMLLSYMVVFFHRLAAAVVRQNLVDDFGLSGSAFGSLASMYFYAYMVMQIPVGYLADSLGARATVTFGMALAGTGSLLFGLAPNPVLLFAGRFLVGIGVSTVFIATLKVLSMWFRERQFGMLSGVTNLVGSLGGVLAQAPLAWAVAAFTWRMTFVAIGAFSLFLGALCWLLIRNAPTDRNLPPINPAPPAKGKPSLSEGFGAILSNWRIWPSALFYASIVGIYLAFSGAWGISYLEAVYGLDRSAAAGIASYVVFGAMAGGLMTGGISDRIGRRKPVILAMTALFCLCLVPMVFWNGGRPPLALLRPLFFVMGVTSTAFILTWAVAKEINPPRYTGMAVALVNTVAFFGAAMITTAMGFILDRMAGAALLLQYRAVFSFALACSLFGIACALFMPETGCRNVTVAQAVAVEE